MSVSVIIPNWNGMSHLPTCLASLSQQSAQPDEVIVVDNGSRDGSVDFIRKNYPKLQIIEFPENRGFAAAVNAGIHASSADFLALLNNDTELDPHWIEELVRALRGYPAAGSVTGKMLDFTRRNIIDGVGDVLSRGFAPVTRGAGEADDGRYGREEEVFAACAGAAIYRRTLFDTVGLFDEEFISYYEDEDLAFRAQLAGFTCLYVPSAICYHKRGASSSTIREYPVRMQERNLTLFQTKNIPWIIILTALPIIIASRTRRIWRLTKAGMGKPALSGFFGGLMLIPSMLAKRRRVQKLRTVPARTVRRFAGGIRS